MEFWKYYHARNLSNEFEWISYQPYSSSDFGYSQSIPLKNLLPGPLLLSKYLVVFLVWLLGCGGKQKVLASPPQIKMICHDAVVDDGKRKLVEAVLLLIPSACWRWSSRSTWACPRVRTGRGKPFSLLTTRGTGSLYPATRGRKQSSFEHQFSKV